MEEEADKKKAAKKAQKAEQKARKAAATIGDTAKKEDAPIPDDDPDGQKALRTDNPLGEASKIWTSLERLASKRVEVWVAGYRIYMRRSESSFNRKSIPHH